MGWTKRQFIEQAFDEIGLGAYVFDLDPQQIESALRRLDSMMGTWMDKGIQIGYPLPSAQADSDPDEVTNVPIPCNEAIYLNLAIRIAPGFGKSLMPETKASAKNAYDGLLARAAFPREQQLPNTTPIGSGNKPWRTYDNPFVRGPDESPIRSTDNNQLDFIG